MCARSIGGVSRRNSSNVPVQDSEIIGTWQATYVIGVRRVLGMLSTRPWIMCKPTYKIGIVCSEFTGAGNSVKRTVRNDVVM